MTSRAAALAMIACTGCWGVALIAQRDDAFGASRDHPAIAYSTAPVADAVSALNRKLDDGAAHLQFSQTGGYLRSVLDALGVPVESQVLVFSQTSSQAPRISFSSPRAIYFNDGVSVGWVRGGDVLEVAAQDRRQGTIFYTLAQAPGDKPRFERSDACLRCHLSWDTRAVPGPFVMSTYPRKNDSEYANGGVVDDRDPISHRWGGWYVTGKQVPRRHMGNAEMIRADAAEPEQTPPPPVFESLARRFDTKEYLAPYSDVVALLVLEHQAHLTNLLTRAGWEDRVAGPGPVSSRVASAVGELVDYMLFVDEAPWPGKIVGSSGFAERFAAEGPRDDRGRSLRDLDLNGRLMRYPLSYMIYSPGFDGLPDRVRTAVYDRLWRILSGDNTDQRYAHLTLARRQAVVEILRVTKPGLPESFRDVTR